MAQLNPKEMQQALAKPFAPEDLEWRLQNTTEEKMRGLAVPYVTNRAIQNRLDEVCGPENWYNDFKPWHSNGKKEAQLCGIAIYFEGRGFITKWDGAEDSDIESVKGGLSDSMKRAAVQWGIGRVLYDLMRKLPGMNAPILPNCGNRFRPCGKRSPAEKGSSTSPNSRKRWRKRLPESKTWACGISGKALHIRRFMPVWSVLPVTGA